MYLGQEGEKKRHPRALKKALPTDAFFLPFLVFSSGGGGWLLFGGWVGGEVGRRGWEVGRWGGGEVGRWGGGEVGRWGGGEVGRWGGGEVGRWGGGEVGRWGGGEVGRWRGKRWVT